MNGTKQKWVLIKPFDKGAEVLFFKGVRDVTHSGSGFQDAVTTELMSDAYVFEYTPEEMQYVLDKMRTLIGFSAVPIEGVDIFKAKLAGV